MNGLCTWVYAMCDYKHDSVLPEVSVKKVEPGITLPLAAAFKYRSVNRILPRSFKKHSIRWSKNFYFKRSLTQIKFIWADASWFWVQNILTPFHCYFDHLKKTIASFTFKSCPASQITSFFSGTAFKLFSHIKTNCEWQNSNFKRHRRHACLHFNWKKIWFIQAEILFAAFTSSASIAFAIADDCASNQSYIWIRL